MAWNARRAVPEDIHVGRDGWLFRTGGTDAPLAPFDVASGFDEARALRWRALLDGRAARLRELGIDYVDLPVPDKLTLMGRFYDGELSDPEGGPIRRLAGLRVGAPGALLNVVPYLAGRIDSHPVYWKTGDHWSAWGCFMACQLLCGRLGAALPPLLSWPHEGGERALELGARLDPPRLEDARRYRLERRSRRRWANALTLARDATGRDDDRALDVGSHAVFVNTHPEADRRTLVLFGDASSDVEPHLLTGMLAETFSEVHFLWSEGIDDAYVERVRPDVVLTQHAERSMARVPSDGVDREALAAASLEALAASHPEAVRAVREGRRPPRTAPAPAVRRRTLLRAETYALDPPITVQPECVDDVNDAVMTTNEVELLDVDDARVWFDGGRWLVTRSGGDVIARRDVDDDAAARIAWETPRRLPGTTLMFGASAGAHCYYHWMLELLPAFGLLERAGIRAGEIDRVLVREISGDWQRQTLARFGFDASRIVETIRRPALHCERVLHVDLPAGINLKMHRFVPQWMKHLYPVDGAGRPRRRLYLARPEGVRRGIANEAQMLPLLEAAGIERVVMEGLSVREQAELLSDADIVIAAHGGALTNTVFCRPGTRVVELLSTHVYPYYYGLAESCGHVYHAVLERPGEDYPRLVNHAIAQSHAGPGVQAATAARSFDVPLDALERVLALLPPPSAAP